MERGGDGELSRLIRLPDELKLEIVNQLTTRRDLLNLSLTCRNLEDMTMGVIHKLVHVSVPQNKSLGWNIDALPNFRTDALQSTKAFAIRSGYMDRKTTDYRWARRSDVGSLSSYVCDVLRRIPADQLQAFSFLHRSPLPLPVLEALVQHHNPGLQVLRIYEFEALWKPGSLLPQNLAVLECRCVIEGKALGRIVRANRETLKALRLGQEKALVDHYCQDRSGIQEQTTQTLDSFLDVVRFQEVRNLEELGFNGLNVSPLFLDPAMATSVLFGLKHLTLESCNGTAELLDSMATAFHDAQLNPSLNKKVPQLKHFLLRHEAPSSQLKTALNHFLSSFASLETLSLLLENATLLDRPSTFLPAHGPTLKTLVLECRAQPRESLGLDTSRAFGTSAFTQSLWQDTIEDICRLCPNLEELGTAFPWNDGIERLKKTSLPTLKKLRTIHIRNFPECTHLSQLGEHSIREYVTRFTEWGFPSLVGGGRPALETLALGPTLYETRWRFNPSGRQPPEFLRTHYFCLDWAKTRFGRWSAMVTSVSERYMEDVRDERPLAGVFEQVWLR